MKSSKLEIGKGISALLGNITEDVKQFKTSPIANADAEPSIGNISRIPLSAISINPKQPRRDFDEKALQELSESIQLHDIIQPITVVRLANKKYQLISGERRYRASKLAGLTDIPAFVRTANSQEMLELALLENLQRENLNAIEIGLSYKQLMDECSLTQEEVAERMKKERSTVANFLRLLRLPPSIQAAVRNGSLSMGHARAILSLEHIEQQLYAYTEITSKSLSVRQAETMIKEMGKDGKKASPKTIAKLPPAYARIQDQMSSHFSTKVNLVRNAKGNGQIAIEFYNDQDLERIMATLGL